MKTSSPLRIATGVCVAAIALVFASSAQAEAGKRKNPTSKLYVAGVNGASSLNDGEKLQDLTEKLVHDAEGVVIETEPESTSAIVFSNGSGVAYGKDTKVEMKRFLQEPFTPNRNDIDVEPSISQTNGVISRGNIGICTSKMVAGSSMVYTSPHASINVRGGKAVIEVGENETRVSLIIGDVSVRGDQLGGGESLKPGQQAVITKPTSGGPSIITIQNIPEDQVKGLDDKVTIACMARRTVYFDTGEKTVGDAFSETDAPEVIVPKEVFPGVLNPVVTVSPSAIP
jgi:hypothetical protein